MPSYRLEFDIHLYYVPPMQPYGAGITVTRSFDLPFPPYEGLAIYGRSLTDDPSPLGWRLKDVTWDLERGVFMATSSVEIMDEPLISIPDDLQSWLSHGWRLGSFQESYPEPDYEEETLPPSMTREELVASDEAEWDAHRNRWRESPRRRPKELNRVMKALIRHMVESNNNVEAAYAMDRTGRFVSKEEWEKSYKDPIISKWRDEEMAYDKLTIDQLVKWNERVKRYPDFDDILNSPQQGGAGR